MRVNVPSLDAAEYYEPLFDAADRKAAAQAYAIESARPACAAIKSIRHLEPAAAAQICAVLSAQIAASGWAHWQEAKAAQEYLDGACDALAP